MDKGIFEQAQSISEVASVAVDEGVKIGNKQGLVKAMQIILHMRDEVNGRIYDRIIARLREEL